MSIENIGNEGYVDGLGTSFGRGLNYVCDTLECRQIDTPTLVLSGATSVSGASSLSSDATIGGSFVTTGNVTVTGTLTAATLGTTDYTNSSALTVSSTSSFSSTVITESDALKSDDVGTIGSEATIVSEHIGWTNLTILSTVNQLWSIDPGDIGPQAAGLHMYTFPANSLIRIHNISGFIICSEPQNSSDATGVWSFGTTEASGTVATLSGTSTWVDIVAQKTFTRAFDSTGTSAPEYFSHAGLALDTGLVSSLPSRSLYFNVAADLTGSVSGGLVYVMDIVLGITVEWSIIQ